MGSCLADDFDHTAVISDTAEFAVDLAPCLAIEADAVASGDRQIEENGVFLAARRDRLIDRLVITNFAAARLQLVTDGHADRRRVFVGGSGDGDAMF